jgi:hypothetical protein
VTRRIYRVVIDVEVDTDEDDEPQTWDWSAVLDTPASLIDVDEVAPVPTT